MKTRLIIPVRSHPKWWKNFRDIHEDEMDVIWAQEIHGSYDEIYTERITNLLKEWHAIYVEHEFRKISTNANKTYYECYLEFALEEEATAFLLKFG